jgi:hypothetical protein
MWVIFFRANRVTNIGKAAGLVFIMQVGPDSKDRIGDLKVTDPTTSSM